MKPLIAAAVTSALCVVFFVSNASAQPAISPFSINLPNSASHGLQNWRAVGIPGGKVPTADLAAVVMEGSTVLRLKTFKSYGTWVHTLPAWTPDAGTTLHWRWRVDQVLSKPDLTRKAGDDAAAKVCVMFDLPLQAIPFLERSVLRMARAISGEQLPAATLCYVWDTTLPAGTLLPNAYSRRVRFLIAEGAGSPLGQWRTAQQKIYADFLQAFGDETSTVPPVTAIVVGADADNTGGQSLAFVADLRWGP